MSVMFQPKECPVVDGEYGPEPQYWANFSNGNAARMLDLAGLPNDPCGDGIDIDLHAVSKRLIRALNQREVYHREDEIVQRPGRCQVTYIGTTEDQERWRIHILLRVVDACIKLKTELVWY
jgi:hypothetical protein